MAKKVDVTFKNPVNEAYIDHLELWRKTGVGGTFAQVGTDFTFVAGTADYTYADAAASSDGITYYYEARAYNNNGGEVEGTDYNKIAANITISAAVTDLYGLHFNADNQGLSIPLLVGATGNSILLKMGSGNLGTPASGDYLATNGVSPSSGNGGWGIAMSTTDATKAYLLHAGISTAEFGISAGSTILLDILADGINVTIDGVFFEKITNASIAITGTTTFVGCYSGTGTLGSQFKVSEITVNGEFFGLEENTGTTATGDSATVATFINTPLWYTV